MNGKARDVNKHIWMIGLLATVAIAGCSPSQSEKDTLPPAPPATMTDASAQVATTAVSATNGSTAAQVGATLKPLEIAEAGYSVVDGFYVEYAFVLRNPNSDFGVQYPAVRLTMRDKDGRVLSTAGPTFGRWLLPGETAAFAGEVRVGQSPAKIDFDVVDPGTKWKTASESKSAVLALKTGHLKIKKLAPGIAFTCDVENPNSAVVDDFAASIILRDKSGRIIAGLTGFGDELPPGSKQTFTVKSVHNVPKFATAEAFAQQWSE